ncbi:MAG: hypothetical protein VW878_01030 [Candidatus Poseidoniales archaeon]
MSSKAERTGFKKRARARAKKHETKAGAPISKEKTTESPPLRRKAAYLLTALICMVLIAGSIGVSPDRPSRNIPQTPPPLTNGTVFFAPIAVPGTPLSPIFSTEMSLTWDRSDIFVVVADGDKKEECDSIPFLEKFQSTSEICKAGDEDYEVVGLDNSTGLEWEIGDGTYYFGIGTLGEGLENISGLNMDISIDMRLSLAGYLILLPLAAYGLMTIKGYRVLEL